MKNNTLMLRDPSREFNPIEIFLGGESIYVIPVDKKISDPIIKQCVINSNNPGFSDPSFVKEILDHKGHIILKFMTSSLPIHEQFVLLLAIAVALIPIGAIGILNNEYAGTSFL
jgi:hypothetical protein